MEMESGSPEELLAEAGRARSKARTERRGAWFALSVFGIIVLAAAPLYRYWGRVVLPGGITQVTSGGWWVPLYWLVAVPVGYVACVLYYRRQAIRTGVAGSLWPYIATGLGLCALMLFVPPGIVTGWIPAFVVGWTVLPLVALAGGFLVLARLERNWYLAAFSIGFLMLPMLSRRIFDQFFDWPSISSTGFLMIVSGGVLMCAGTIAWLSRGRGY
jgi:hypothetical protein